MAHAGTELDPIPQYFKYCHLDKETGEKKYYVVGKNTIGGGGGGTTLPPFQIINSTEQIDETANCIYVLKK